MSNTGHIFICETCGCTVQTRQFAEARECPDCGSGMLVNQFSSDLVEDVLAEHIKQNTAARGVDLFAVDELGYSAAAWAELTGRDRSTVSRNIRRARDG